MALWCRIRYMVSTRTMLQSHLSPLKSSTSTAYDTRHATGAHALCSGYKGMVRSQQPQGNAQPALDQAVWPVRCCLWGL